MFMHRRNQTNSDHLIHLETSSATPTPYEGEVIRLLSSIAAVVHGPHQRSDQADLQILISKPNLSDFDEARPTIILGEHGTVELPPVCVVLPSRTAPSSVAQVAQCLLSDRNVPNREARHTVALETQTCSTWSAVAEAATTFEELDYPAGWLRYAAHLLEHEVEGLTAEIVVAKEGDSYRVLLEGEKTTAWQAAKAADANAARAGALLPLVSPKKLSAHLRERRRDFLIVFPGKDDLIGWILVAFETLVEAVMKRNLLSQVATYLQSAVKQREAVSSAAAWRHAVESGLDSIEPAIVIMDKEDRTLLANQSYRTLADRSTLSPSSAQLSRVLGLARSGEVVTLTKGEVVFKVAPWGSLQNGCVLHGYADRSTADNQHQRFNDWLERFTAKAKSLGLKLSGTDVLPAQALLIRASEPEAMATELARPGFKAEILMGISDDGSEMHLCFDQEGGSEETTGQTPGLENLLTEKGSLGRRLSVLLTKDGKSYETQAAANS